MSRIFCIHLLGKSGRNDGIFRRLKTLPFGFGLLLLGLTVSIPCFGEQRTLVLVGDQRLKTAAVSPIELRRLFLGFPQNQHNMTPLINMTDPLLYEVFLQKVVFMSANAYEKQLSTRLIRTEEKVMPIRIYDTKTLIKRLNGNMDTVTYMWQENAKLYPNLKIIQILWTGHQ